MAASMTDRRRATVEGIAQRLREDDHSTRSRKKDIRLFSKYLRRGDRFQATWDAVGGARGLADLMAGFSVRDIRSLCPLLGQTASAIKAQPERRAGLSELVTILDSGETDSRPLRDFYQSIVPACNTEFIEAWESDKAKGDWTWTQQKNLRLANRERYEQKFLRDLFSKHGPGPGNLANPNTFAENESLFSGNLAFCETILVRIASATGDDGQIQIPSDFFRSFAMPLLRKLAKRRRRSLKDVFNRYLSLVIDCFKAHPRQLRHHLRIQDQRGLIQYTLRRLRRVPEDRELLAGHLVTLVELAPTNDVWVGDVHDALNRPPGFEPHLRFKLIRIFLQHCDEYLVDIKDISPAAEKRILAATKSKKLWPASLFLCIPVEEALALFEKLESMHQGRSFVSKGAEAYSILRQEQGPGGVEIDLDIVRTFLQRRKDPTSMHWVEGVRLTLEERRKKATESREHGQRAFWAKSALHLCVAAGDLAMLQETIVWARRFVKDPLVGYDVFGPTVLRTSELLDLLVAVPVETQRFDREKKPPRLEYILSTARRDIAPANQILLILLQTGLSAIAEPSFKARHWSSVVDLPKEVSDERLENVARLMRQIKDDVPDAESPEPAISKVIWKPTLDGLLDMESLMSDPAAPKIVTSGHSFKFAAGVFMAQLSVSDPALLAELTTQYLEGMRARLAPTLVKSHMSHVVAAVVRLTQSTRPSLAIPFVRPIIQNSDDSSSHRQILTNSFLESLTASAAREFMDTTATAMLDLMKEQNARPPAVKEGADPAGPIIKVTTIKMLAQILEGNRVLDPNLSCEILVSLLKEARHIDARVAIISSLLSVLVQSTSTPALRRYILDVFDEYVLPAASQLNERRPTLEEDWQQPTTMPEVSDQNSILTWLRTKTRMKGLKDEDRERLVGLITSALQQSAVHNERWMKLFVSRHCPEAMKLQDSLRTGPAHSQLLVSTFYEDIDLVPDSLIDTLEVMLLNNVAPTPEMLKVTAAVKSDPKLAASNAGRHWLSQFDSTGTDAFRFGIDEAVKLLRTKTTFSGGEARAHRLQEFILSAARRWIRLSSVDVISALVDKLTAKTFRADKGDPGWRGRCMPIIEEIILVAQEKRDAQVLVPNVFRLRLALLNVPLWQHEQPLPEAVITSFASELSGLIDELASYPRPYHADFEFLKSEISRSQKQRFHENARVGLALAQIHDEGGDNHGDSGHWLRQQDPSLAGSLRCELVATYIENSPVPEAKTVKEATAQLLREWTECPEGHIRAMGIETRKTLNKSKGWFEYE